MRTFMLLVLTIVAVTESKRGVGEILLMEIIDDVDQILKSSSLKSLNNQFVKEVFPTSCSEKHLCQAAMVMINTPLNHSMLHRRLFAYANYSGHHQCNVSASDEHKMNYFLKDIKKCCQELSYQLKQRKNKK
ncbi:interleukin-4 [Labeo rohita]|uniref:interleukin-4 n=1 Tax=Labeo rohita TaxID=84645 RepID=UPI0021E32B24|nr:interleukin-4 [Labeo rohita]XP_050983971.1 interleukin-4 [Labeo rohita]